MIIKLMCRRWAGCLGTTSFVWSFLILAFSSGKTTGTLVRSYGLLTRRFPYSSPPWANWYHQVSTQFFIFCVDSKYSSIRFHNQFCFFFADRKCSRHSWTCCDWPTRDLKIPIAKSRFRISIVRRYSSLTLSLIRCFSFSLSIMKTYQL
jgi:hypothetical protein